MLDKFINYIFRDDKLPTEGWYLEQVTEPYRSSSCHISGLGSKSYYIVRNTKGGSFTFDNLYPINSDTGEIITDEVKRRYSTVTTSYNVKYHFISDTTFEHIQSYVFHKFPLVVGVNIEFHNGKLVKFDIPLSQVRENKIEAILNE